MHPVHHAKGNFDMSKDVHNSADFRITIKMREIDDSIDWGGKEYALSFKGLEKDAKGVLI